MIFEWICIICIVFLPLYLWAYGATRIEGDDRLLQGRFWAGIFSGGVSVGLTWLLASGLQDFSPLVFFGGAVGVFMFFYILVLIYTYLSPSISSGLIRRMARIHLLFIFLLLWAVLLASFFLTGSLVFGALLLPLFIAAFFEETTKHLATLGLIGKNITFSQKDMMLFAFYVVLGFVCIENILYLQVYGFDFWTWVFRSTFTFSAHLLSATLCTLAWYKALSYPLAGWRYFLYFFLGFFAATLVHMGFNYFVETNHFLMLFVYLGAGYIIFTQSLVSVSPRQDSVQTHLG
ncbi:hypothetical protein CSB09_00085 [Candidatus Gracilibacteria bacterium]|nr:MAG: hypothetical protein CSB09_00085 [Candidatus Gracilibacteria bacterium]